MSIYASVTDLYVHGLALASMGAVTLAQQNAALDAACAEADSKFRARYELPLQGAIDVAITQRVCQIAAFEILCIRGFNPQDGADRVIMERAIMARKWFDDVERQTAHPLVIPAVSLAPVNLSAPNVQSKPLRGW